MNTEQLKIREQQKQSWNKFSGGWKKWDDLTMNFMMPLGLEMIHAIEPGGTDKILDIAAGTGEPGLTIAGMLQGGKVVITDLSPDMLKIANENAAKRGITNIETMVCDVCELPFAENSFDAASCRMGFMFFPDIQLAINEIFRVLKPDGHFATAVWSTPDKNFWITVIMSTIAKNMQLPPQVPGAPGMFRCAAPGLMKSVFEKAGFKNIVEKEIKVNLNAGTLENYWDMMTEVAAPVVAGLNKADDAIIQKVKMESLSLVREKYGEENISVDGSAIVIAAEK
jgi:ubiquinone/menaquinone biosynthesis C-methylase UbiE